MSDCYIYGLFHERPSNNYIPHAFYIGRGSGRRMNYHLLKSSLSDPNNSHKANIIKKCKRNNWKVYPKKIWKKLSLKKAKEAEQFILNHEKLFSELTNLAQNCHGGGSIIGENCPQSKLSNQEVRCIKWLIQNKSFEQKKMAEYFDISEQSLSSIKAERNWSHVESKKPDDIPNIEKSDYCVTKHEKSEIKWLLNNTQLPQKKISSKYDFSVSPVSDISSNPSKYEEIEPKKPDSIPEGKKQTNFLPKKEVSEIKWLSQNTNFTSRSISKKYNVCGETVRQIRDNMIHKKTKPEEPDNTSGLQKSNKVSKEKAKKIKWYIQNTNLSQSEIGSRFSCHRKTVGKIKLERREKYKELEPTDPQDY